MVTRLETGDADGGTRQFMETVAFGPGVWELIAPEDRRTLVSHAPTYLDEARDPIAHSGY